MAAVLLLLLAVGACTAWVVTGGAVVGSLLCVCVCVCVHVHVQTCDLHWMDMTSHRLTRYSLLWCRVQSSSRSVNYVFPHSLDVVSLTEACLHCYPQATDTLHVQWHGRRPWSSGLAAGSLKHTCDH